MNGNTDSEITHSKVEHARQFAILAAMILCLELEYRRRATNTDADDGVMLGSLEKSCEIWKDVQDTSDKARRVYRVLSGMLSSFGISKRNISAQDHAPELAFELPEMNPPFQFNNGTASFDGELFGMSNEMDIDWVGCLSLPMICIVLILT